MKKLIRYGRDDHPEAGDDSLTDKVPSAWAVAILDDCEDCDGIRVELTVEEVGRAGYGNVAHLSPEGARELRAALTQALKELGEER